MIQCYWLQQAAFVGGMEEVLTGAMRIVLGDSESHPALSGYYPGLLFCDAFLQMHLYI